jgi:hypothetical protein
LDGTLFPSGRELTGFCNAMGVDFDRVTWTQDQIAEAQAMNSRMAFRLR